MAELNFNANIPFPPAAPTTQTPSTPPHIAPGSPIDKFLSRTQANLTAQADAEPVIPPQVAPAPVKTFWPEDFNVVTAAEVVVNEPEAARFPVEPVINPQFEAESQTQIEPMARLSMTWEAGPKFETPAKRGPGRPKGSGKPKEDAKLQSKVLYARYMTVCQERKAAIADWDRRVAGAWSAYLTSKV